MHGLPLISSSYLHLGCFSPRSVAVVLADSVHCFLVGDSSAVRCGSRVAALSKQSALVEQATAKSYGIACRQSVACCGAGERSYIGKQARATSRIKEQRANSRKREAG